MRPAIYRQTPDSRVLSSKAASCGGLFHHQRRRERMVDQEMITPPVPLPTPSEPSDVLHMQRTIDSLEQENAWLKARIARMVRDK